MPWSNFKAVPARLAAIPVLALLLLSACVGPSSPPLITLNDQGDQIDGLQGAYCWDAVGPALCVDPIEPRFDTPYPLPAGAPIQLNLEKPLPGTLTLSLSEQLFGESVISESLSAAETVTW